MAGKYLDYDGLSYLWGKLKAYVSGLFNSDVTIGGKLSIKNGQSDAQIQSLGSGTYVYLELNGGVKVLRLVSNSNGNIGLYDPATSKWIIRADSNGNVHIDPDTELAGNFVTNGNLTLSANNTGIHLTDANGNDRSMIYISANNYFGLGYGMYNASTGETRIYGHTLGFYSHNDITSNKSFVITDTAPRIDLASDSSGETLRMLSNNNGNKGLYNPDASMWLIRADSGFNNLYLGQEPILGDHSSPIGTVKRAHLASSKSINNETATQLCSITLEKGVWMVVGYVRFPANSTGVRRANISTTSGASDLHNQQNAGGSVMQMQVVYSATVTATSQVFYLNAYQSSGTAMTMTAGTDSGYINGMVATRIA